MPKRSYFPLYCCFFLLFPLFAGAQTGCPGCTVSLPANLPADTLYLPTLPPGVDGKPYDESISFRVPKTTTPVNTVDSTTPPGLPISKIEVVGIDNVPPGLFWQASQMVFETATQTDGCIRFCGTPTKPDSFVMTVRLKATVLIFNKEASFPLRLFIGPKVSITDGFTMTNYSGCGNTTVTFSNNVPSGGNPGITYTWDFGDGTTYAGENPPPHAYTKPGQYEVNYHATIDTAGYRLVSATVLSVDACTDQLGLGLPDLYLLIKSPTGATLFNSSPYINNTVLPHTFPIGLTLAKQGNYTIETWDEDSGLEGSDDPCGTISFNILSGDTLVAGGFKVVLNIVHPVDSVLSKDTVTVLSLPPTPKVSANKLAACAGDQTIVLQSSFGAGNQWWVDGHPISGATDFLYMPITSGFYQVQLTGGNGCSALSDSAWVEFYPLPAAPTYLNDRNNLELIDIQALPDDYALQWYLFAAAIDSATGLSYCAKVDGKYTLVVTDLATGCTNSFSSDVVVDSKYDCSVGTQESLAGVLRLFPNPAQDFVTLELETPLPQDATLQVWDVAGRLMQTQALSGGLQQYPLDGSALEAGMYFVELNAGTRRFVGRLVIGR